MGFEGICAGANFDLEFEELMLSSSGWIMQNRVGRRCSHLTSGVKSEIRHLRLEASTSSNSFQMAYAAACIELVISVYRDSRPMQI